MIVVMVTGSIGAWLAFWVIARRGAHPDGVAR